MTGQGTVDDGQVQTVDVAGDSVSANFARRGQADYEEQAAAAELVANSPRSDGTLRFVLSALVVLVAVFAPALLAMRYRAQRLGEPGSG